MEAIVSPKRKEKKKKPTHSSCVQFSLVFVSLFAFSA